ncbi:hypothetical protein DC20_14145 [Rufibacter tibetensis]|uniref:Uncharacterized protein n=1 Tax=Rufibacter tibetensis TaxID=512763 RepID=A0A0P0CWZ8_9BACT|nr:hypothetical protein DC20_14145 [Rufibacter tibetensis]
MIDGFKNQSQAIIQLYKNIKVHFLQNNHESEIYYTHEKGIQIAQTNTIVKVDFDDDIDLTNPFEKQYSFIKTYLNSETVEEVWPY